MKRCSRLRPEIKHPTKSSSNSKSRYSSNTAKKPLDSTSSVTMKMEGIQERAMAMSRSQKCEHSSTFHRSECNFYTELD